MSKTEFTYDELHELLKELNHITWITGHNNLKYLNISIDTRNNMNCRVYDRNKDRVSEADLLKAIEDTKNWKNKYK